MLYIAITSFLAGVAVHCGIFIRGEWHMRITHIIVTHIIFCGALFYYLFSHYGSLDNAIFALVLGFSCYLTSLFASMTTYRLFFHATSAFPGPRLAAVTKLWHVWHTLDSRNYLFLQRLHSEYGEFVRTGKQQSHETGIRIPNAESYFLRAK